MIQQPSAAHRYQSFTPKPSRQNPSSSLTLTPEYLSHCEGAELASLPGMFSKSNPPLRVLLESSRDVCMSSTLHESFKNERPTKANLKNFPELAFCRATRPRVFKA